MTAKIIGFIIVILCFTSAITILFNVVGLRNADFGIAFEDSYYLGNDYISDSRDTVQSLTAITGEYKNEENILNGKSLTEDDTLNIENQLYRDFQHNSKTYNPNLTTAENYKVFKEVYADNILKQRNQLIKEDLHEYRALLQRLEKNQGLIYYAKSGENTFTNIPNQAKDYFTSYPSHMIFDGTEQKVFPEEIKENIE